MLNKKGFTLIEIIVTLAVLAVVGLILAINMNDLTGKQNSSACKRIADRVESAADIYINNNNIKNQLYNGDISSKDIFLSDLVNANLLDEKDLKNPKTKKKQNYSNALSGNYLSASRRASWNLTMKKKK